MMDFDELEERERSCAQTQSPQDSRSGATCIVGGDTDGVSVRFRGGAEYSAAVGRSAAERGATRAGAKADLTSSTRSAAEREPAGEPAAEHEPAAAGDSAPQPPEEKEEEEQEQEQEQEQRQEDEEEEKKEEKDEEGEDEETSLPEEPAAESSSAEPSRSDAQSPAADAGDDLPAATGAKRGSAEGAKAILSEVKHKDASSKDADGSVSTSPTYFNAKAWERLDRRCSEIPGVSAVAEYTNVSPLMVAVAGSIGAVAFLLHGFGGQMVCTLLGCLYPAFESFKAAESSQPSVMQFWLMYWVVWSLLTTVEQFFWVVLIWVPFYYPLKLVALLWLFHPATRGARFVYRWFILPSLQRNQERIDAALEESSQQIKKSISGALSGAVGAGLNTALAAGGGVVPRVRSLSGLMMEAVLSKRSSPTVDEGH